MTQGIPLSQHELLEPEECEEVRDQVLALRDHWTSRSQGDFLYTLGAASYLDAPSDYDTYVNAMKTANPVLTDRFEWLHDRVRLFFEDLLDEPVFLDTQYAVPGFHIFIYRGQDHSNDNVAERAHFDLQWMHAVPGQYPTGTLSFTVPVEEPTGGSSLAIWHTRYEDAVRHSFTAVEYASKHAPQIITYARGRIVVHDGYILHAIGRSSVNTPEGFRITLQGHGVRLPQGWLLYW